MIDGGLVGRRGRDGHRGTCASKVAAAWPGGTVSAMEPSQRFAALVATSGEHLPLDEAAVLIAACAEPDLRRRGGHGPARRAGRDVPGPRSTPSCPHLFGRGRLRPATAPTTTTPATRSSTTCSSAGSASRSPCRSLAHRGRPPHRRAAGRRRHAGPLPVRDKVDRDGLHRPVPRRPAARRAAAASGCSTSSGGRRRPWSADYLAPVGQPVDRGPDAQQPAGDLRPAPRLRRARAG